MQIKIYDDSLHAHIAASYHNIGDVCQSRRDHNYSSALDYVQKSFIMRFNIYGNSPHHDIILSYESIGDVYRLQGDFSSALDYFHICLNMGLEIYGDSPHPDVAKSYRNIGLVYRSQRDYSSALTWLRRALAVLPPGLSCNRTQILKITQILEWTTQLLVTRMVRTSPPTIQSHSKS